MIKTARINHTIKNQITAHVETCSNYCMIMNKGKITLQCQHLDSPVDTNESFYVKINCKKIKRENL